MRQIVTPRLILRPYITDDVKALHLILSDKTTMGFWPEPFTTEQTRQWIEKAIISYKQNGFGRMAVILKENDLLIGDCGIMITETNGKTENDLGYIIHSSHWRRGYASEAARACIEFGFNQLGLRRLTANMGADNIASARTAEKIGMTKEKEFYSKKNRGILTHLYSISKL